MQRPIRPEDLAQVPLVAHPEPGVHALRQEPGCAGRRRVR
jgi:hypothetical protein